MGLCRRSLSVGYPNFPNEMQQKCRVLFVRLLKLSYILKSTAQADNMATIAAEHAQHIVDYNNAEETTTTRGVPQVTQCRLFKLS